MCAYVRLSLPPQTGLFKISPEPLLYTLNRCPQSLPFPSFHLPPVLSLGNFWAISISFVTTFLRHSLKAATGLRLRFLWVSTVTQSMLHSRQPMAAQSITRTLKGQSLTILWSPGVGHCVLLGFINDCHGPSKDLRSGVPSVSGESQGCKSDHLTAVPPHPLPYTWAPGSSHVPVTTTPHRAFLHSGVRSALA